MSSAPLLLPLLPQFLLLSPYLVWLANARSAASVPDLLDPEEDEIIAAPIQSDYLWSTQALATPQQQLNIAQATPQQQLNIAHLELMDKVAVMVRSASMSMGRRDGPDGRIGG